MKKFYLILLIFFFVTSLKNTIGFADKKEQFCDIKTITEITKDSDGNITDEKTFEKVVCDDGAKHYLEEVGVAKECKPYVWSIPLGGKLVEQQAIACEKLDGTYEIIPSFSLDWFVF